MTEFKTKSKKKNDFDYQFLNNYNCVFMYSGTKIFCFLYCSKSLNTFFFSFGKLQMWTVTRVMT